MAIQPLNLNKVWVAYSKEGWKVKVSDSEMSEGTFQSKNDALDRGRQIANERGAAFLAYNTPED